MTSENPSLETIYAKLNEMNNTLLVVQTNQKWVLDSIEDMKSNCKDCTNNMIKKVESLGEKVNHENELMCNRIVELEKGSWYSKGFFTAIGAVFTLIGGKLVNLL